MYALNYTKSYINTEAVPAQVFFPERKRHVQKAGLSGSEMNPYRFRHTVCADRFRRKMDKNGKIVRL